jgi:hypothetical protein
MRRGCSRRTSKQRSSTSLHLILAVVWSFPAAAAFARSGVGFGGRGKRGGARVIYLFGGNDLPVFLLAAFAKNERDDLTPTERSLMAKAVAAMLADYRRRQ